MESSSVTVVARIRAKEGMAEAAKQELLFLVKQTKLEPGCNYYDLYQTAENKSEFVFIENWVNKDALDKHLTMPYLKSFLEKADNLLAAPVEITLLERIS